VDLLTAFLVPDFGQQIHPFVVIPSAIADISMVLNLLMIGVRLVRPDKRILATARTLPHTDGSPSQATGRVQQHVEDARGITRGLL
jgi:hypothetical protein